MPRHPQTRCRTILHSRFGPILLALLGTSLHVGCDVGDDPGDAAPAPVAVEEDAPNSEAASEEEATTGPVAGDVDEAPLLGPPPEPEFVPVERLVITGATVLSSFEQDAEGRWTAQILEDTSVLVEEGRIARFVASSSYQLSLGDVVVTARGRFVVAAPIVRGSTTGESRMFDWLEGGRLVDAALAGVGIVALPEDVVDTPAGRCVLDRIDGREIPAAVPLGVDAETWAALDGAIELDASMSPTDALEQSIRDRIAEGVDPFEILADLSQGPAAALGRPDLGSLEVGSEARMLILDGDPTVDPTVVLRPFAMTFGDRVMRLAEIQVLRDASERGEAMRRDILALEVEGVDEGTIRRWYTSTQAQVYAGLAAGGEVGDIRFTGRTGQPRFDRIEGRLRAEPGIGEANLDMVYTGPPQSFEIATAPSADGLTVELALEGGKEVTAAAPGSSAAPIIDLALDLDLRRGLFQAGEAIELELQELIYGNGPIGLAPRRYRFTPIAATDCPPCFEAMEQVWLLEIFDLDLVGEPMVATAFVAFRDGRPTRARFDTGVDPVWVEEFPQVGIPAID